MTPRPHELEPEFQQNLAQAALESMDDEEREYLLGWMVEYAPQSFLTAVEGLRWEQHDADGWDMAD